MNVPYAPHTAVERYVALGDSYTIGEGARTDQAWPNLLTAHLQEQGISIALVANPSVSGWTTTQLIDRELPIFEASQPTFATLLIGVNDWVQGTLPMEYADKLVHILDRVQAVLPDARKLILLTIPDFSAAPEASKYGRERDITQGIAAFNEIIEEQAALRSLPVIDIFGLSRELCGRQFISSDGLHPSAIAYGRWEQLIYPVALSLLS